MQITNEELLKEVSERELRELSDLDASGETNQAVVDNAVNEALSFIESFFALPDNPTPLLKAIAIRITILNLRRKNGISINESMQQIINKDESYLMKMSKGNLPKSISEQAPTQEKNKNAYRTSKPRVDLSGFRL